MMKKKLRSELNFSHYLHLLQSIITQSVIIISASNTPCGPFFTQEISREFMDCLGLKINLVGCFRHAYIAVIDKGIVTFEKLSQSRFDSLELRGKGIHLVSGGFEAASMRNTSIIEVNGKNYSANRRGLNFAVFNAFTGELIDACAVDTYVSDFVCIRPSFDHDQLLRFKNAHPDVNVVCFNTPSFPTENLSENEMFLRTHGLEGGMVMAQILGTWEDMMEQGHLALTEFYPSKEAISEVLTPPESYIDLFGVRKFKDHSGKNVNTALGIRITAAQPEKHSQAIFVVGGCLAFGVAAADNHTIASFLQQRLNCMDNMKDIIVYNYGYYLLDEERDRSFEIFKILDSLPVRSNDIVLILGAIEGVPLCDLAAMAKRPHDYGEVFVCVDHYTPAGYQMIADGLFTYLNDRHFFRQNRHTPPSLKEPAKEREFSKCGEDPDNLERPQALLDYEQYLRDVYQSIKLVVGAVVMNCNPFTTGHKYLVEEALKKCSHLVVFVVQEDKSVFPFADRLDLVKKGLKDLSPITVLPSGNFIISMETFKEYFNKSEIQDQKIDASLDVTLFAKEIAPCLNISKRFVGEEPFDNITKQYNDAMKAILPQYGIEVIEIPRKQVDGVAINASMVRNLAQERKWDALHDMVPYSTLEYLKKKYP